ncbi:hypothetical protein BGZ60DRAFT_180156 [Tricladium varicosporioides]|nr:hypothetical protein BGZ60DRAFT_180156 [Hymenoscyphus varicosporioides]
MLEFLVPGMAEEQRDVDWTGEGNVWVAFHDESARFNLSSHFFQEISSQNLAFVNLTSSTAQDEDERRLVRRHVQHGVHQQKQLQRHHNQQVQRVISPLPSSMSLVVHINPAVDTSGMGILPQQDAAQLEFGRSHENLNWDPTTNSVPSSSQGIHAHMTCDFQGSQTSNTNFDLPFASRNQSMQPTFPSGGRLDPFNTLPRLRNGREEVLSYHYTQVLVKSMLAVAVDPEDKWFGYSVTDPALFYSTMLHSAAHDAFLSGRPNLADSALLKWEAIRLINNRLNDPVHSVSDVMIGAVVALALFENQEANVETSNIHMEGLCQMVYLRGGLQNLGLAGILRRKILWADVCNSMYTHSKPRFANFLSLDSASDGRDTSPAGALGGDYKMYNTQLDEIFSSLRSVSYALSGPFSRSNVAVDEIYSLENRVVVLLADTNPIVNPGLNLDKDEQSPLLEHRQTTYQILLAAQIYIYLFLRDHFVLSPIFSVLVTRLCDSLYSTRDQTELRGTWQEMDSENRENDMLFWVLLLGTLAADGREGRSRLQASLGKLCNVLGIRSPTEVVDKAKSIAWIEKKMDDKVCKLWHETQR